MGPTDDGAVDTLEVVYFPIRARAEPIKLALEIAGLPWRDTRVPFADWPALKASQPFGSLPVLRTARGVLPQSVAILRYVGRLGGLYPEDLLEAAYCDALVDACEDAGKMYGPSVHEKDAAKKAAMRKELAEAKLPPYFAKLDAAVGEGAYCVGGKLSIADLAVSQLVAFMKSGIMDGIPSTITDPVSTCGRGAGGRRADPTTVRQPHPDPWCGRDAAAGGGVEGAGEGGGGRGRRVAVAKGFFC